MRLLCVQSASLALFSQCWPPQVRWGRCTSRQEEEEPLSAIVTLQRQNVEWMERCLELAAENEKLKEDNKKLRGEGERERVEGDWKERGEVPLANLEC